MPCFVGSSSSLQAPRMPTTEGANPCRALLDWPCRSPLALLLAPLALVVALFAPVVAQIATTAVLGVARQARYLQPRAILQTLRCVADARAIHARFALRASSCACPLYGLRCWRQPAWRPAQSAQTTPQPIAPATRPGTTRLVPVNCGDRARAAADRANDSIGGAVLALEYGAAVQPGSAAGSVG